MKRSNKWDTTFNLNKISTKVDQNFHKNLTKFQQKINKISTKVDQNFNKNLTKFQQQFNKISTKI